MPNRVETPYGYECPYRGACPHLQGMSAEWMWLRHQEDVWKGHKLQLREQELVRQLQERDREIYQLRQENAKLQALHRAQFKPNASQDQESEPKPEGSSQKEKKRPGPPKGHPPWTRRKADHVDRTVEVPAPKQCPHCQCAELGPWPERCEHLQEDIVLRPQTWVVCFNHGQAWCPNCRRPVMQTGEGEMIGSSIGPVAKSAALYLRHGIGISCRHVQAIMEGLFGLPMTMSAVIGFERSAARRGQTLYEDLHQKIQASEVLHADETSWRVDGQTHWLWYAGHENLAYFHIDPHRSAQAAEALLGTPFKGILNTDDDAAYNGIEAAGRQSCLAHPLRLAREALQLSENLKDASAVDSPSRRFLEQIKEFLTQACEIGGRLRKADPTLDEPHRIKSKLQRRLKGLCKRSLAWEPAEQLRCRLWKQRDRLFTFVDHPQVQPTNNQAEQSLRASVILRKITFGNRSEQGARCHALFQSFFVTAHRQGRDGRSAIEQLLTQPAVVAQKAFYRDSKCQRHCSRKSPSRRKRIRRHTRRKKSKAREPPLQIFIPPK